MRAAIVTGGGSGIGRATAFRLAAFGYTVVVVGRTLEKLSAVVAEIEQRGGRAAAMTADVSRVEEVDALVRRVAEMSERIGVLVNNAGSAPSLPLAQVSPEQWHEVLNSNLSSAFYMIRAVWPHMEKQFREAHPYAASITHPGVRGTGGMGGVIINISSMASRDPFPGLGAYAVAKAGLNMLTLMTAREGAPVGIRVVGVAPGAVDTAMFRKLVGDRPISEETVLQPDDVAALVADAVGGSLHFSSGETLFLHRNPA